MKGFTRSCQTNLITSLFNPFLVSGHIGMDHHDFAITVTVNLLIVLFVICWETPVCDDLTFAFRMPTSAARGNYR